MPLALPDIAPLAAAVFLLLIAASLWIAAQLVQRSLGHAPVIGGWITAHIVAWLYDARDHVVSAAKASWHAAVVMFTWAERWITNTYDTVVLFAASTADSIRNIVTVQIPREVSRLESRISNAVSVSELYARSAFGALEKYTVGEMRYLRTIVDQSVSALEYRITVAESDALSLARQALQDAEAYGNDLYRQAQSYVAAEISSVRHDLSTVISSVESAIKQVEAEAVTIGDNVLGSSQAYARAVGAAVQSGIYTDLNQWADAAVAQAWPDAAGDIAGLGRTLGTDMPWLRDLMGALGGAGAAGLAGALVQALAGTHAVTRLAEDCIVPTCRNLSGLSNALGQLANAGAEAALIAWLAEAVSDPAAWAHDTDSILRPVADPAVAAAKSLLGR